MAEERVPVLETKCLGIQFGGLKAVNDVNIEIYPGVLPEPSRISAFSRK